MRQQGVEHLGEVRTGLLETDGNFSLLLYATDETGYGLPLSPNNIKGLSRQSAKPMTLVCIGDTSILSLMSINNVFAAKMNAGIGQKP